MREGFRRQARAALLGIAAAVAVRSADAQDVATAEDLFREGRALIAAGELDAACPKFAESLRIDPSSGTLINLAACHERQGRVATAWLEYRDAARLAHVQRRALREVEANRKASELEPRLSYLMILVTREVPGLELRGDEVALDPASPGSKIPVDPGRHHVVASAPGFRDASCDVQVAAGSELTTCTLPPLEPLAPPPPTVSFEPPAPPRAPSTRRSASGPLAAETRQPHRSNTFTLGWVLLGVGATSAVAGGAFGVAALSRYAEAQKLCVRHQGCSDDAVETGQRAFTYATMADIGFGVGAASIVTGLWLVLRSGPEEGTKAALRTQVVPRASPGAATLSIEGRFW